MCIVYVEYKHAFHWYSMNCMSTTQYGYTPLVVAAQYGECDVVIELLDNGADVNAQDDVSPLNTVIVYTTSINNFKSVVNV